MHLITNSSALPQSHHQHQHLTDEQLLQSFSQSNNNVYLGILLERYTMLLFGLCIKYLKNEENAKDAVQQVFVKALAELQKYKVVYFKSWIYMVARNHCLMLLRHQPRTMDADAAAHFLVAHSGSTLEPQPGILSADPLEIQWEALGKEELLTLLEQGLTQLQPQQSQCVQDFYLKKMSYQQIADTTGFSMLQVKSYIQNGKRNLKLWIEKQTKHHAS
ncbi:MAG: sigma-70 family RNA polymerase sigma factor [Bacteroidetes bacterium]|nr:MAG: sigma-70 family RNA polymerase sigma factor [Bacteroidota bacterium]